MSFTDPALLRDVSASETPLRTTFRIKLNGQTVNLETYGVGQMSIFQWLGFGLGMLNKLLEPAVQAVWAYVLTLLFVIIFIQFKPSGLFPAKGRLADV